MLVWAIILIWVKVRKLSNNSPPPNHTQHNTYHTITTAVSDKDYWESMEALPFGFLETETIVDDISDLMKRMQPDREDLPSRKIVEDVVEIFREHKVSAARCTCANVQLFLTLPLHVQNKTKR